ncbi:MAG: AMP-dependent synthetase/ligase [Actinomycetales bacterium]
MPTASSFDGERDQAWWLGDAAPRTLADLVVHHAQASPGRRVMSRWDGSVWAPITAATLRRQVEEIALGLIDSGVQPGDRVALMAKTRYEWTLVDLAIWAAGAVGVPVYESSSADQLRWICQDSEAVAIVVENRNHAALVEQIRSEVPKLTSVWTIDPVAGIPGLGMLAEAGAKRKVHDGDDVLRERREGRNGDDLATLIYTSGTTGRPKGVELTHANFLAEVTSAIEFLPELFEEQDSSTLLFLPLAHVFGRMIQVAVVLKGVHTGHSDVARIIRDLPTFAPTFVLAVPRVFERVHDGARRKAVKEGRGRIFDGAASTAIAYSRALDTDRGPSLALRALHAVYSRLVYTKIRAALGGSAAWAISGGAALGERLGHFYRGIGVTVLEGYGLTETTAASTVNTAAAQKIGTVGRPLPGFEVRIAEDGEVLVKGGHVFTRYWRNPEATAEALPDGWFHTGDLGSLDPDGFLTITGRKKEILVTSAGKNVSPAPLEDILRSSPLVSQALVVGDGRTQIAALVTLDPEGVAAWLESERRPLAEPAELVDDPGVRAQIKKVVDEANATVSSAERIARFRILATDWTEASGHLTPSMKLKRGVIMTDFADQVEALYTRA